MDQPSRIDLATAPAQERDRWLRELAVDLYWKSSGSVSGILLGSERRPIAADDSIDPILLKDTLLAHGGKIDALRLEGIVKNGVGTAVADGFL